MKKKMKIIILMDKRRNAGVSDPYGPELFDIESTVSYGAGVTRVGDTFECVGVGSNVNIFTQLSVATLTESYKVEFTITGWSEGGIYQLRPFSDLANAVNGNGSYNEEGIATQTSLVLRATGVSTTCTISNISVKKVL